MQTIGITGGTGFVGKHLSELLIQHGYKVVIFTRARQKSSRNTNLQYCYWSPTEQECDTSTLKQLDAVVHLAGAGVADKRWTPKRKEEIRDSRVAGTRFLIDTLRKHAPQCNTLIAASAIGFYGPDDEHSPKPFREEAPPHNDFLGTTCKDWEAESARGKDQMRTVILRFGIILGKDSGAFPQFAKPQDFGVVPIMGSGRQMISWLHIDDLCRMILWTISNTNIQGIFNAVAPQPVSNKQLMNAIAAVKGGLKIPVPVPAAFLRIGLGEMSIEILKSCTVSAEKVQHAGFHFTYPDITAAVKNLLAS